MAQPEDIEDLAPDSALPPVVQDALDDLADQSFVRRMRKDILTELTTNKKDLVDNPGKLSATITLLKDMEHGSLSRTRLKVDSAANKGAAAAAEAVGYLLKNLKPSQIALADVPADFKPPALGEDVPRGQYTPEQVSTDESTETFTEFQARVGSVAPGANAETKE
jgi:hypothetical protein